jgi:dTDP-4-dehydrorhamnose 3,5-epimerase
MNITPAPLPGVLVLEPKVHGDERGFFLETYRDSVLAAAGVTEPFVQDNQSRSRRGTLRGLHYQLAPHAQGKLVRVSRGRVFDVAVDVRRGSPHFGQWFGAELDDVTHRMLWIPPGFAHAFIVLSEEADFVYKCTATYAPAAERGIAWNDPGVGIAWPDTGGAPLVSPRDEQWPTLAAQTDLPSMP